MNRVYIYKTTAVKDAGPGEPESREAGRLETWEAEVTSRSAKIQARKTRFSIIE